MKSPINIEFDLVDVIGEYNLTPVQVNEIASAACKAVTAEIYRNWTEAANRELKSTRQSYIRGLVIAQDGSLSNTITLVGALNNMVENGVGAFDMKAGFMKSSKIKYNKKGGWYLTIPFRMGTPGTVGDSEVFAGILPVEIYNIIKDKAATITNEQNQVTSTGESLSANEIPSQFVAPSIRQSITSNTINNTFDAYTHKSSIYEGLMRNQKTYESSTQSTYGTFRRVGSNSDINAFIHSGIQQHNLASKAIENTDIQLIVDNTVDKILSELGL